MIQQVYGRYIHKSAAFLFPLLGIKRHQFCRPTQTYLRLKGFFVPEDLKLFCMYTNTPDSRWRLYQRYHLINHPMMENYTVTAEGDEMLYIFDLAGFKADVRHFLQGRYSQFLLQAKQLICDYYGLHTAEWAHMQSYLFPERFYEEYAQALNVDEQLVREGGELCPVYDRNKETLDVELPKSFWQYRPHS